MRHVYRLFIVLGSYVCIRHLEDLSHGEPFDVAIIISAIMVIAGFAGLATDKQENECSVKH